MGLYIPGIETPANCFECRYICGLRDTQKFTARRHPDCPLVPIPPHGKLIDADALDEVIDGIWDCNDLYFQPNDKICDPNDCKGCKWRETMDCFRRMVKHTPTIIPAEVGE